MGTDPIGQVRLWYSECLPGRSSVDRASVFGTEGRGFESLRPGHLPILHALGRSLRHRLLTHNRPNMLRSLAPLCLVAVLLVPLAGCQEGPLILDVRSGRTLTTSITTETTISGGGVFSDRGTIRSETKWDMTFGEERDGIRQVHVKARSVKSDGEAEGASVKPDLLKRALAEVDLNLSVNQQGRTVSWSEDSDRLKALGLDLAAFAATATFRAIGPLGVVLPKGPLKKGASVRLESDIGPILGLNTQDESGALSFSAEYIGDEKVGRRNAAKLAWSAESTFTKVLALQGSEVEAKGAGKGKGVTWIDKRTGLALKSEWKSSNTLELDGALGALSQEEQGFSLLESLPE